jgi:hypothetical protein
MVNAFFEIMINLINQSNHGQDICYSVLKLFTGFATAALIAWKPTVKLLLNNF